MAHRYGLDCINYLTDTHIAPYQRKTRHTPVPEATESRFQAERSDLVRSIERKERELQRLRALLQTQLEPNQAS